MNPNPINNENISNNDNNENISDNHYTYNNTHEKNTHSGNMYSYRDDSINEPPKESNAIRRSVGQGLNPNTNPPYSQDIPRKKYSNYPEPFPGSFHKNSNRRNKNILGQSSEMRISTQNKNFEILNGMPPKKDEGPKPLYRRRNGPNNFFYLFNFIPIGVFHIIMIVLIGVLFDFDMDQNKNMDNNHFYLFFKDIHLFIFIGFGMLYSALRDHQWSSIFLVLFLGIVAIEFSFFSYFIWANTFAEKFSKININFNVLICIEYCAASAIVSLGGLLGKLSLIQYFVVVIFETFMSCFNFFLCYDKLDLLDNGGSITIHLFGAIFGLGVSIVLFCNDADFMKIDNNPHITSNYRSNMFAFIGSIFLWLFFPSFNVAIVKIKQYEKYYVSPELGFITENLRYRGIINTYLSMIGSVFTSFIISPLFYRGNLKIEHILHASYVGGIVIGGCCTICSNAWASIVIGIIGSTISILFLWRIKKLLHSIRFEDTIGVLQIFAIPGLLGGIVTAIYLRNFTISTAWNDGGMAAIFGSGNAKPEARAGMEIACIFVSLGIAAFSGVITGFLAKSLMCIDVENYFVDSEIFMEEEGVVFPEFEFQDERMNTLNSSGNKLDYEGKEININNNQNFGDNNINNKENNNVNNFNNIDNVDNIDV